MILPSLVFPALTHQIDLPPVGHEDRKMFFLLLYCFTIKPTALNKSSLSLATQRKNTQALQLFTKIIKKEGINKSK